MPTPITLPSCLMDCYTVLFPKLDFDRVAFFSGLPSAVEALGPDGFTEAPGNGPPPDIHVYIKSYDPCSEENFLTIAHELVHVVQIQGMTGGGHIPGSWAAYYASHVLGCSWRGYMCANELEKEAYDYSNGGCGQTADSDLHRFTALRSRTMHVQPFSAVADFNRRLRRSVEGQPGPGHGVQQRRADMVLAAHLSAVDHRRRFLHLRVQQHGRHDRRRYRPCRGRNSRRNSLRDSRWPVWCGPWRLSRRHCRCVGGRRDRRGNRGTYRCDRRLILWSVRTHLVYRHRRRDLGDPGHSRLSTRSFAYQPKPPSAFYNGKLYVAYRGAESDDLWYNVFDGTSWLANDIKITQGGHTKTSEGPALAAYNGKLYLAYRGAGSDDLWYNFFDGASWLANDIKITQGGHTKTSRGPALAVYNNLL